MQKTQLVLVDGSSYLYRAYHALPPLTTSKNQATGAIFGVINMLRRLIKDYEPSHLAVIFDDKGKTFRDELYGKYKAHRPAMPDELQSQIAPLYAVIAAMGLPLLIIPGVEADDVIATLCTQATKEGWGCVISTCDKDLAQLVTDEVHLVNTMSNTRLTPVGVQEKFGVLPAQIVDFLSLTGDTSDQIPGIPGVGPKTAAKWLTQYGSLTKIIAAKDSIGGKVGESLRAHLDQLPLAQQLVTVRCDVPLPYSLQDLAPKAPDDNALRQWFTELEFKSWLTESLQAVPIARRPHQYKTILTENDFAQLIDDLKAAPLFALNTESTGLDYMRAELIGLSFALDAGVAYYLPFAHDYIDAPAQLLREWALTQLKPILESSKHQKVGHHIKVNHNILAGCGIAMQGMAFDSMLESYIWQSTGTQHNNLPTVALKYLGHKAMTQEELIGKGAKKITFNQISLEKALAYAAENADTILQLHQKLWPQIETQPGLRAVLQEIEMPLIPVLARMERHGVLLDRKLLEAQSHELANRIALLEEEAYQLADCMFNLNSPKQLQEILFEKLKLPMQQKTAKGQASTAEAVLEELAYDYPLPKLILEYRSLSKLKSTYTDQLPNQINPQTGRVHTSYHQAIAATGRLSSSDPNLQNIPIRSEEGRRIRQAFIAPPRYQILAADYSQIELRIMAHFSDDPGLLTAFAQGLDIHTATAAEIFDVALSDVTPEYRRSAKTINFGLLYGMSAFGLAKRLGLERQAAQTYVDRYFARYPGVKSYMDDIRIKAREQGFVEGLFGRRLYLPEINSANQIRAKAAERAAINAPMQGTAADIIKRAMIAIDKWQQKNQGKVHLIMQVHDELVFEVAEDFVSTARPIISELMMNAAQLKVPLEVDIGVGFNWDEAH